MWSGTTEDQQQIVAKQSYENELHTMGESVFVAYSVVL